jgi:hypothetical protein
MLLMMLYIPLASDTAVLESVSASSSYLAKKKMYKQTLKKFKLTSLRGAAPDVKKRVNSEFQRNWKLYVKTTLKKKRKLPTPTKTQLAYRAFFREMLSKYGVKSPAQLQAKQKSAFFMEIKKGWGARSSKKKSKA